MKINHVFYLPANRCTQFCRLYIRRFDQEEIVTTGIHNTDTSVAIKVMLSAKLAEESGQFCLFGFVALTYLKHSWQAGFPPYLSQSYTCRGGAYCHRDILRYRFF